MGVQERRYSRKSSVNVTLDSRLLSIFAMHGAKTQSWEITCCDRELQLGEAWLA